MILKTTGSVMPCQNLKFTCLVKTTATASGYPCLINYLSSIVLLLRAENCYSFLLCGATNRRKIILQSMLRLIKILSGWHTKIKRTEIQRFVVLKKPAFYSE